jgi:plasmid stabilization system protein ParE
MSSYVISPLALEEMVKIQVFIARDNPHAAEDLVEQFFSAFEHPARWPRSGHTRTDLTPRNVLFWPLGSDLIVYTEKVRSGDVLIVAVLHGARDLPGILEEK